MDADLNTGQLREWLKELGLPAAGRKAELIARLRAEDNDDEIDSSGEEEPVNAADDSLDDLTTDQLRDWLEELRLPTEGCKPELIARLRADQDNDEEIDEAAASPKAADIDAPAWKPDVGRGGLAFGAVLNTYFLTAAVHDYSAAVWVAAATDQGERVQLAKFLAGYAAWKAEPPIISAIMLPLLVLLPLALVGMVIAAARSAFGWSRATPLRHTIDVLQPLVLVLVILPTVIYTAIPAGSTVASLCAAKPNSDACTEAVGVYQNVQLFLVLLNALMLGLDVLKGIWANRPARREKQA